MSDDLLAPLPAPVHPAVAGVPCEGSDVQTPERLFCWPDPAQPDALAYVGSTDPQELARRRAHGMTVGAYVRDDVDEMHVLREVACRLWEPGDWEPRWERWLAWWGARRTSWLGPRRAFGVWLREELGLNLTPTQPLHPPLEGLRAPTTSLAGALTEIAALRAQLVAQAQRHEDELADLRARHAALLGAIHSDAQAATHQTIGQYRSALIRLASRVSPVLALLALAACGDTGPTPPKAPPVWYCDQPTPPPGADPRYCQIPRLEVER